MCFRLRSPLLLYLTVEGSQLEIVRKCLQVMLTAGPNGYIYIPYIICWLHNSVKENIINNKIHEKFRPQRWWWWWWPASSVFFFSLSCWCSHCVSFRNTFECAAKKEKNISLSSSSLSFWKRANDSVWSRGKKHGQLLTLYWRWEKNKKLCFIVLVSQSSE